MNYAFVGFLQSDSLADMAFVSHVTAEFNIICHDYIS